MGTSREDTPDYTLVAQPVRIDAPGNKLIEEIFGRVSTGSPDISVAHMVAPPGWSEPAQTPAFDEITVMVRGSMTIDIGDAGQSLVLSAGQSIRIRAGVRVRYRNPHDAENEYYAICLPAFSLDAVNRDA